MSSFSSSIRSTCDVKVSPSPLPVSFSFPFFFSFYFFKLPLFPVYLHHAHVLAAGVADSLGISRRHDFLFLVLLIRLFTPYFTGLGTWTLLGLQAPIIPFSQVRLGVYSREAVVYQQRAIQCVD
ncbi:uncharacterized protein BDW43DRAFT_108675 [Aspergillus alliaceus]|uniref:uncharacterized protein n=1 Tax=Petromyces alliaceus TaxID=209559 RepID=UPI0012A3B4F0|nr:uncharacterized protein BDW43DRAFT_108675 [Aspergillus alliaceus]KAB8232402.1 hypothetical protein BDW43DRAFT_108675 [Aspergillus alliaceus]